MEKRPKKSSAGLSLPRPSSSDLRGRQSVRATFKLTERAIETLSIISGHLGIKQKSLFDHLIEDAEALSHIAGSMQSARFDLPDRVQKTYVLSRKTLSCLERVSRSFNASRDALVEYSIHRLIPLIKEEQRRHGKRREIQADFNRYVEEGVRLLADARARLGEEDPLYARLEEAVKALLKAGSSVSAFMERTSNIEAF